MGTEDYYNLGLDIAEGKGVFAANRLGVYRGIVEYNRDPLKRGRVMVRVAEDGREMQFTDPTTPRVSTFDLGWCDPCFGLAGGKAFGAFSVPVVGSKVYVMYSRGDPFSPVYFGGWVGNPGKARRYGATKSTLSPPIDPQTGEPKFPAKEPPYWDYWEEPPGNEIPEEALEMENNQPDTHVFFKTMKGAILLTRERDYAEETVLIDRQGAELRFTSNTNGYVRRGMSSASKLTARKMGGTYHRHNMHLIDASRQGLRAEVTNEGDSKLEIHQGPDLSKDPFASNDRVSVLLNHGEQHLTLEYVDGGTVLGTISIDPLSQKISIVGLASTEITADTSVNITAPDIRLVGNVTIDGNIRAIGGNKLIFVDSDNEPFGAPTENLVYHDDTSIEGVYPQQDASTFDREEANDSVHNFGGAVLNGEVGA